MPQTGERTLVTLSVGGREATLPGTVVYVESGMGFAVQFKDLSADEQAVLAQIIEATAAATAAS